MERRESIDGPAMKTGEPRRKRVSRLVERVREKPSVQEIELIYIETGWLTPTIALVILGKLAEKVKQHPVKLPRMRKSGK